MSRIAEFHKSFNEALATIEHFKTDANMAAITNWLLNTDASPYSIFADAGGRVGSAESFAGLLQCIHHALVDDGDICFPVVNGRPRICFVWQHEKNVEQYILTAQEKGFIRDFGTDYEITFLDNIDQFIAAYDAAHIKFIKRCFLIDARAKGVQFATKNYSTYKCFDPTWVNELN